jgi:DNA polymerase V
MVRKKTNAAKKGLKRDNISEIFAVENGKRMELPQVTSRISAGFPSPADDYIDKKLDLNEFLVRHPASTFFVRVIGDSMINAGMNSGDLIVVDRSIEASSGRIVLAVVNGEFTVKRFVIRKTKPFLVPENDKYKEIEINENTQFEVWGVVTSVIHEVK